MESLEDVPSILNAPYVVRIKILSQLTLQEQLILRQVCKTMKEWIDISSLAHHIPVTVIEDHGEKTFERFLEKRPPHVITKMHIKNEKSDIFMDPSLPYFLHLYSSSISSLHVKRFFTCKTREECMFYESFSSLTELKIDKISIPIDGEVMISFPNTFKCLTKLELGDVKAFPEPPDDQFGAALIPLDFQRPMGLYVWNLIGFCENIEYLVYPNTAKYFFQAFVDGRGRGEFGMFCDYVRSRSSRLTTKKVSNLSTCDFRNDTWPPDSKNALTLLKMGKEFGIKYLNVNANLFQFISISALTRMYDLPTTTGDCIQSFKNFNCLINEKLPSVKKISLVASDVSARLDYSCSFNGPDIFHNLEEIEINVDVGFDYYDEDVFRRAREFRGVHNLLSHFFYNTEMILVDEEKEVRVYHSVTSLIVTFNDIPTAMQKRKATPQELPLKWIVEGLPNLRKLRLVGWNSGPEIYDMLWNSFKYLEELIIEDCESMLEVFRGASECGSAIQYFKELRKITLKGKSTMNDVSDDTIQKLFEDRMNLSPSEFLNRYPTSMTWTRCGPGPI